MDIGVSDRGGGALSLLEAARRDAHAVCRGKGQSLELILRVSGASPELEATVDGLLWLINDGVLFGRIVLLDDGMDEETREIARRLSLGQGNVTLWTKQTNSAAPCSSSEP